MATIVLDQPVQLPVRELERHLSRAVPAFKWRVGDESDAIAIGLDRPATLIGLAGPEVIMMAIELRNEPLPVDAGAPEHRCHIRLSDPSTEQAETAKRIVLLTASALLDGAKGFAQLAPGGSWYHSGELTLGRQRLIDHPDRARIDEFFADHGDRAPAPPPGSPLDVRGNSPRSAEERMMLSDIDHSFAKILTEKVGAEFAREMGFAPPPTYAEEEPREDRLPTFVLALDRPLEFDWTPAMEIGRLDPGGQWQVQPGPKGTGTLVGRGCTVSITLSADPIPSYMLNNALARSFWFKPGEQAFRNHSCSLIVTCDLDTRAAPFEDVHETAKIMTLLLGLLTRSPGCVALLNNGVHTLLEPEQVQSQVGHLHKNQIPLMLWTWTAPDSMVKDSVSMSTGGMRPFLGYEVEVWNAPGEPAWVGDKLSEVLNYLLHVGPVVKDGDTFGESKGDRSIRGFFGTTKAQRGDTSVKALMLEFEGPGSASPHADAPQGAADPTPKRPIDLISLVALTKPTPFPSNIIQEMLEGAFPGMTWKITIGDATLPHLIEGSGDEGIVKMAVDAFGLTIPASLMPPAHRLHVTVRTAAEGDTALARRAALVVCSCLIIQVDPGAHFQLSADGNWLDHDDAMTAVVVPKHTKDIGDFDRKFGRPPLDFRGCANPPDAYPPARDDAFEQFRAISASSGPAMGVGLKEALASAKGSSQQAPPPAPRPGGFGRRLFGRRGS